MKLGLGSTVPASSAIGSAAKARSPAPFQLTAILAYRTTRPGWQLAREHEKECRVRKWERIPRCRTPDPLQVSTKRGAATYDVVLMRIAIRAPTAISRRNKQKAVLRAFA